MSRILLGRDARRAFSLIELLIVVTIIMILAGLLLPALRGVRRKAWAVNCLSNLHDIGTALLLYEQEYNGFPRDADISTSNSSLDWGLGGKKGAASTCGGASRAANDRPMNRFFLNQGSGIKELKTFRCPADIGEGATIYCCPGASCWDSAGSSYLYVRQTGCFSTDLEPLFGKRMASLVSPARKIALFEPTFCINRDCDVNLHWRHHFKSSSSTSGKPDYPQGNVLFANGSVRYVVRDKGTGTATGGCLAAAAWPDGSTAPEPAHDWY